MTRHVQHTKFVASALTTRGLASLDLLTDVETRDVRWGFTSFTVLTACGGLFIWKATEGLEEKS